jgi:hypothetical protein
MALPAAILRLHCIVSTACSAARFVPRQLRGGCPIATTPAPVEASRSSLRASSSFASCPTAPHSQAAAAFVRASASARFNGIRGVLLAHLGAVRWAIVRLRAARLCARGRFLCGRARRAGVVLLFESLNRGSIPRTGTNRGCRHSSVLIPSRHLETPSPASRTGIPGADRSQGR